MQCHYDRSLSGAARPEGGRASDGAGRKDWKIDCALRASGTRRALSSGIFSGQRTRAGRLLASLNEKRTFPPWPLLDVVAGGVVAVAVAVSVCELVGFARGRAGGTY